MKRQKIVAGNWKMNKTHEEALSLAQALTEKSLPSDVKVIVCTPSVFCSEVGKILSSHPTLAVGAQN